jgi:hypothetical protein
MGVDKRDPCAPAPHPPPIHPSSPHLMVCKLWRRRHRCRMGRVLALALPRERGGQGGRGTGLSARQAPYSGPDLGASALYCTSRFGTGSGRSKLARAGAAAVNWGEYQPDCPDTPRFSPSSPSPPQLRLSKATTPAANRIAAFAETDRKRGVRIVPSCAAACCSLAAAVNAEQFRPFITQASEPPSSCNQRPPATSIPQIRQSLVPVKFLGQ